MKNYVALIAIAFISIVTACKKEKLPKATQVGANTFACRIDGVIFKPSENAGLFGSPPITVYNDAQNGFALLGKYYGERSDPTPQNVIISLDYLKSTGIYNLNDNSSQGMYELDYAGGPIYQ